MSTTLWTAAAVTGARALRSARRRVCKQPRGTVGARAVRTVQRTKYCRSELPANEPMRGLNAPRAFVFLPRVPILRHCDAFVTNFTAEEFRAMYLYSNIGGYFQFLIIHCN
ncbi:hypothetical protein EVAR_46885_1 [Eumeta japonica]|uniref:Uncharacterized protein n=1 Tax=Eumeta variegata TaxID=151549 RepID=A0A4C1YHD2_EUMVA|nr:hypothetical protein EVAR_46885_1 [Eumeta japonica]